MKFAASTTLKRAGAGVALAAAMLSATGCGYIYKQPTTINYAPSDGVKTDVKDVHLRNIMLIAENKDSDGRVLGTIVNNGSDEATVKFAFTSGTKSVTVPAGKTVRLEDNAHKFIVSPAGEDPGKLLSDTKISVGSDTSTINIPVLDGTLDEYQEYLPNAASSDASAHASHKATEEATHGETPAPERSTETAPAQ